MLKYFRYISPSFVFFNNLQKHQPHQPGHKKTGTASCLQFLPMLKTKSSVT